LVLEYADTFDCKFSLDSLNIQYRLYFEFLKHLWQTDRKDEALMRLTYLSEVVDMVSHCEEIQDTSLRIGCWLELGEWKLSQASLPGSPIIPEPLQADVLTSFKRATLFNDCGYRAWHDWALLNFRIALQNSDSDDFGGKNAQELKMLRNHVVAAVQGFVHAISQGTKKWCASVQQDLLNFVTCLFKFGNVQDVSAVINSLIGSVSLEAFLGVLPQLLARIHIKDLSIRSVLHPLLTRLGEKHPQALMYPLSVLMKSPVAERKASAESLMNSLKNHSIGLVEEALMVSSELIRVAILWLETWHEGLEDASRLYFGEGNVSAMLELLVPLHEKLEKGAETGRESEFIQNFGQDLHAAHLHIKEYMRHISDDGMTIPPASQVSGRRSEQAETAMIKVWGKFSTSFVLNSKYTHTHSLLPCCPFNRHLLHSVPSNQQAVAIFNKVRIDAMFSGVEPS
jgi:serine/threonine-protein kinase mTOR